MFVPGGVLLYVGDTEDKDLYRDDAALNELNLYNVIRETMIRISAA